MGIFSKGISLGRSMGIFAGFFEPPGDGKKWEASVSWEIPKLDMEDAGKSQ